MPKPLIVADSSPLISVALAGRLSLLKKVYQELILPEAVYDEVVVQGRGRPGASEIREAEGKWIEVMTVSDDRKVQKLQVKFGAGESQAIVLAEELEAMLFADEAAVISEARERHIPITSTILMLLEAKTRGFIPNFKKEIDNFIAAGFRISEELYRQALKQAGES